MEKSYHHGDLKSALINLTLEMVEANEVHLVGFRELARRLEVSRTAPYRHFTSVEHLLASVVEQGYLKFIKRLQRVTEQTQLDARSKFLQLGIAYINFALDHPAHYRLMFDRRFFVGTQYPTIKVLSRQAFDILRATVQENRPQESTDIEIKQLSQLAWACVHGIARLFIDGQWQGLKNRQDFIRISCEKLLSMV